MPIARSVVGGGPVVDPFVGLIKHSCQSNAYLMHEGPVLRVREKDLRSVEELTICYVPIPWDYVERRLPLIQQFGLDCACELCTSKGPVSLPEGPVRGRVLTLSRLDTAQAHGKVAEVETAIREILQAGYGYGTFPLWDLYYRTIRVHLQKGRTPDCLKAALKVHYLVEPAQIPETTTADRIGTLYVIVSLMNVPRTGSTTLKEFPDQAKTIIPFVFLHLRARLAALTEKCFGADSVVAKFEKDYFRSLVKTVEDVAQKQGLKFEYEPLKNNERETGIFVENMNELLVWAGIPAFTEVQLLAD
jgi:hypothetical protein